MHRVCTGCNEQYCESVTGCRCRQCIITGRILCFDLRTLLVLLLVMMVLDSSTHDEQVIPHQGDRVFKTLGQVYTVLQQSSEG